MKLLSSLLISLLSTTISQTSAFSITLESPIENAIQATNITKQWAIEGQTLLAEKGDTIPLDGYPYNPLLKISIPVGMKPDEFFQFLASVEGYKLLDPDSNINDFNKPVLGPFVNTKDAKMQVEHAKFSLIGGLVKGDYVVLNSFDFRNRIWYSGSVICSKVPGSSGFNDGKVVVSVEGRKRAPILAFYYVLALGEDASTLVNVQFTSIPGIAGVLTSTVSKDMMQKLKKRTMDMFPLKK